MGKGIRRLCALMCAGGLMLGAACARAEFSPRYGALLSGAAVRLEIGGRIDQKDGMADSSLTALNQWLSRLTVSVTVDTGSPAYRVEADVSGEQVLAISCVPDGEGTLTVFSPAGNGYRTSPGQPDALALLAGRGDSLPDPLKWAGAYFRAAPQVFDLLSQAEEPRLVKEKTAIQYAASPPMYESYTFKEGALNGLWPQTLEALLPAVREALADQPEALSRVEAWLRNAAFDGDCRIRRYLDQNGGEAGFQFSGRAGPAGDMRKVSLLMGFTPGMGGSISLSMPAVKGKNTLKWSLGGRLSEKNGERTLTVKGASVFRDGQADRSAEIEGTIKSVIRDGDENWSGKITLTLNDGKAKVTWTLTPEMTFTDAGLRGEVALLQKTGGKTAFRGALILQLTGAAPVTLPETGQIRDLRGLDTSQARALAAAELPYWTGLTARMFASLPEDVRNRLTHDLRTGNWMTGPDADVPEPASAPEELPMDTWAVEEEDEP